MSDTPAGLTPADWSADLGELVPTGGGDAIPLRKPKLTIGRRGVCDITLDFPNISSQHCELLFENGYWKVADLASRNGVKVNGERVDQKWLLPGDLLRIAKHEFSIRYTPLGKTPPPEAEEADSGNPFGRSLLEKAGLARPERRSARPAAPPRAVPPPRFSPDEDEAAGYLLDE